MSAHTLRSLRRPLLTGLFLLLTAAPVEAQTQEVVEYYAVDTLGSVRVVFDASGAVTAQSDYLPFGEAWAPSGNLPAQRFTGQQRDAEEGWDHFNARNLSVRLGRFNRLDPVFAAPYQPQAWNRYAYALNSPLIFVDPDGRNAQGPGEGGGCSFVTGSVVIDGKILPVDDASCVAGGSSNGGSGGNWGGALLELFFPTAYAPSLDDSRPRGGVRVADAPVDNTAAARFGEADGNAVATGDAMIEGVQAVGSLGAKPAVKAVVKSAARAGARSLDDLSRAASAADRNGFTAAGRALQKHGDRAGSAFPQVSGHGNLNRVGQFVVDEILTTPGARHIPNRFGGIDVVAPGGRGVRYDANGKLMGFLEP